MRNKILEIVVLMVDYIQQNQERFSNSDELSSTLKTMGYSDVEISSAYSWLIDRFDDSPEKYFSNFSKLSTANRVLTSLERSLLSTESHGYLLKLLKLGLMDQEQFESILEKISHLGIQPVAIEEIRVIVSAVVFRENDAFSNVSDLDSTDHTSVFIN